MTEVFTNRAKKILFSAQEESAFLGKSYVGPEHLLLAIVKEADDGLKRLLGNFNLRYSHLRVEIEALTANTKIKVAVHRDLTPAAKLVLRNAVEEAYACGAMQADLEHLMIALLKLDEGIIPVLFREIRIERIEIINAIYTISSNDKSDKKNPKPSSMLDRCGINLTAEAMAQRLDPVIGRKTEINRMIRILARRSKNNPVLIGDPGVGKTAIVEGLAQKIVSGDVPETLDGKQIYQLSLASLIAGAKFRGDFEERIKNLIDEIKKAGNLIIFIDEVHIIVGAGAPEGGMDAANILKPALARGEIQLIGATTIEEYRRYIEKDMALERRLQPIMVDEPSVRETVEILFGLRSRFEEFHKVSILDEALEKAAQFASRYLTDRFLPDKAIDLIDEAAAQLKLDCRRTPVELRKLQKGLVYIQQEEEEATRDQKYELAAMKHCQALELEQKIEILKKELMKIQGSAPQLTAEHVAVAVSEWTKIPVQKLCEREMAQMLNLKPMLSREIIGQDEALDTIASAIKRARVHLSNPNRPLGSFVFLGPSGVGKTETARVLARVLFDSDDALIRIDMSELMEKHAVSRLIGAPPGYIGYEKGGQLTEQVRRKPYSVILFDEIEKAHPDVFNILLQILEDGRLTSSQGKMVNFKNTIIIMTSNIGTRNISENSSIGFMDFSRDNRKELEKTLTRELKNQLNPELINRIDEIIIFNALSLEDIRKIAGIQFAAVQKRLLEENINLTVSDNLLSYLAKRAQSEKYGARPLRRLMERMICDFLAETMLEGNLSTGDEVKLEFDHIAEKILIKTTE
ncbi:MAG: ATP-dependent Clp protease ATP-binding subunit [Candidatus Wallbacteria bacterium]|nr:ATP-dependent Clp protease ATP-binding subunit [Candidatus Wallbacteria bacterium]